jgi:PAS domain S-box-containing protein
MLWNQIHIMGGDMEEIGIRSVRQNAVPEWQESFDAIKDAVFLLSPDCSILRCNSAAYEIFNKGNPGDMLGKICWEVVHGTSEQPRDCPIKVMMKTKKRESFVLESDGRWLSITVDPVLDGENNVSGVVHVVSDITERKLAEAEMLKLENKDRQFQKSESLNRMSGAVAHHFNNKLHVVMGYLDMVIGILPPGDSLVKKLVIARRAAREASEVSGNLLAYTGQIQEKIELLDLAEICRAGLPELQAGTPENVSVETALPFPGPFIRADEKQVRQILVNLVINAREAIGRAAGSIQLRVKTLSSSDIAESHRFPQGWHPQKKSYACLELTDSGCGIQEKDMDNIFDPFFSTKFIGRGLGLPVVLGIVRTHGAGITVEKEPGGGSCFKVFFPLSEQIGAERDPGVTNLILKHAVLLVEDEKPVREMTAMMLGRLGFAVFQARDGVEAMEVFKQHNAEISCVLCDVLMPRMGGWETICELRAARRDLPVILASGYDESSVMAGEHTELPDFFLPKPYDLRKLGDTISGVIAGESMFRNRGSVKNNLGI